MSVFKKFRNVLSVILFLCGFGAIYLFLLFSHKVNFSDNALKNILPEIDSANFITLYSELLDMEDIHDERITTEFFFSGKQSSKVSSNTEYGISYSKKIADIPNFKDITSLQINIQILSVKKIKDAVLVVSIDSPDAPNKFWEKVPLSSVSENSWSTINANWDLKPELIKQENTIKVYIWNKSKEEFFADDLFVVFKGKTNHALNINTNSNYYYDLETTEEITGSETIKSTTAHSGTKACDLSSGEEYGITISKKISELGLDSLKKVSASIWIYPLEENPNTVLTATVVDDKGQTLFWGGKSTENNHLKKNQWSKLNAEFRLPSEKFSNNNFININIWNKGRNQIIADDLEIVYGEPADRKESFYSNAHSSNVNKEVSGQTSPLKKLFFEKQSINVSSLEDYNSIDEFLAGDYIRSENNLDELICIKNNKCVIYTLLVGKGFVAIDKQLPGDAGSWWIGTRNFSGDFNSDGLTDVLSANKKTGNWQLLNFVSGSWKSILKGASPLPEKWLNEYPISVFGLFESNQQDVLYSFGENSFYTLVLNTKTKLFEEHNLSTNNEVLNIFKNGDYVLTGNFNEGSAVEFLQLNLTARFDLRLLRRQNNSLSLINTIDFKGYDKDYNPKYYEMTKLVAGNFIDPKKTSLLAFSCNCANFENKCKTIENLSFLPNAVNLYHLEATHE